MTKTKPISHLKPGETLVLTAWDGSEHRHQVAKIEDDGTHAVRVHIPPTKQTLVGGGEAETSPSAIYVEYRNVNVGFETRR